MKLNLLLGDPQGALPGYVNVDPLAGPGDHDRVRCDPADLQPVCDAGEADEVLALGLLEHVPAADVPEVLSHWASRLAHGGTLTVAATDLMEVAKAFAARMIGLDQANRLLHGQQGEAWQYKQSAHTVGSLASAMASLGLRVEKKRVNEMRAIVVARRP